MKNITFSAQDEQIALARQLAEARGTTLNEEFRVWLTHYINQQGQDEKLATMRKLLNTITTPAIDEKSFPAPLAQYRSGTPLRDTFNEREARMLKRLDGGDK